MQKKYPWPTSVWSRLHKTVTFADTPVQYGCVRDDQMPIGTYRRLKPHEIKTLRQMAMEGEKK